MRSYIKIIYIQALILIHCYFDIKHPHIKGVLACHFAHLIVLESSLLSWREASTRLQNDTILPSS